MNTKLSQTILIFTVLFYATAFMNNTVQAQSEIIAHRGYWKTENSAQNSITGLRKAAEAKVYGSEFDVQLTGDGVIVVNHDDNINGITIAETPYSKLNGIKLKNGEKISTLEEYLSEGKKLKNIQMILEIKPHKTKEQETEIAQKAVKLVRKAGMEKQIEYISFSQYICETLAKLTPGSKIAYLNGDLSPKELKEKGINGIDYNYKILKKKPEWVKEAHQLGMTVNVWTVNDTKDIKNMIDLNVDYITTDNPIEALELAGD